MYLQCFVFLQFLVIHTAKGFSVINEAEVYVFLEFSCFFYDPMNGGNLISSSSAFSKSSLYIWNFSVQAILKPCLEHFEHYLVSMWNECNCVVVWTFYGIAFLWDWNENWPLPGQDGLGKETLGRHQKALCAPGLRWKEWWPHKRLNQTCLWVFRSLQLRCWLRVACCRVRDTDCSSPSSCAWWHKSFWRRSP